MLLEKERKIQAAKNVIVFIGDGMGISTVTATRVYKGQRKYKESGEEHKLYFDEFPYTALVKVSLVLVRIYMSMKR